LESWLGAAYAIRHTPPCVHLDISAADLIDTLNPMVRGWANYHRHVVSKRTFARVNHAVFSSP
jgi:hypothetical protein